MAQRKQREPEAPKVERVDVIYKPTGAVCTVGSDVVEKMTSGRKAQFRLYDAAIDGHDDDETDDEPVPPAKKAAPAKAQP